MRHGVRAVALNGDVEKPRSRLLKGDEEDRLLAAASPHLRACIVAALDCGLRRGEVLGLQFSMIEGDWLRLPPTLTKTSEGREVPLSARLAALVEMRRLGPDGEPLPASAHVFGNPVGEPLTTFKTAWRAACRRASITGLTFHDLRREAASRYLELPGATITDVRDLLGHTNIAQTNTYLSSGQGRLGNLRDRLNEQRMAPPLLTHAPNGALLTKGSDAVN
jgi:integrase